MRSGLPPDAPLHQRAAHAFHATVSEILREKGLTVTQAAVAAIVGEQPAGYSNVLNGRTGSLDRVADWVIYWSSTGRGELELVVRPGEVLVRRVAATS